jgi:hypothetical protein
MMYFEKKIDRFSTTPEGLAHICPYDYSMQIPALFWKKIISNTYFMSYISGLSLILKWNEVV